MRDATDVGALLGVVPLVDGKHVVGVLDRQPFEDDLEGYLPYLRAVCHRPASRLRTVQRMAPVGRVRRIGRPTVSRLAAHSEDWAALRPDGVRPDRLLSPERDLDFNLYENRVAARLVEGAGRFLAEQISAIRRVEGMMSDIRRYFDDLGQRRWHSGRDRLWELVSELVDRDDWHAAARTRLRELESRRTEVSALRASVLWKHANRRTAMSSVLRNTNLFSGDERYRHVATLWRSWRQAQANAEDARGFGQRVQEWYADFSAYAAVLMVRAVAQLDTVVTAGQPGTWSFRGVTVGLSWQTGDVLMVERDGVPALRMVALPHALTAPADPAVVRSTLVGLTDDAPGVPTLVVYPGALHERAALPARIRLSAYRSPEMPSPEPAGTGPWLVPVSPVEIDTVTRLTRLLRWILEQPRFAGHPHVVRCGSSTAAALTGSSDWLAPVISGVAVTRPPAPHEVQAAVRAVTEGGTRRGPGPAEAQDVLRQLDFAVDATRALARCPRCDMQASYDGRGFQSRDDGTFRCRCADPGCDTVWETRRCRSCTRTYAVIEVRTDADGTLVLDGDALDRRFADELLAAPCWLRERVFLCPWCAACGNETITGCRRCDPAAEPK